MGKYPTAWYEPIGLSLQYFVYFLQLFRTPFPPVLARETYLACFLWALLTSTISSTCLPVLYFS